MHIFARTYSKEIQSLSSRIENYCHQAGFPAPCEPIAVAASLTGEAIWAMAGFEKKWRTVPGMILNDPYVHLDLLDEGETLADAPLGLSPLADLRVLLEKEGYPVEKGPELRRFLVCYKGKHLSPNESLFLPLPEKTCPQTPVLKANVELRDEISAMARKIPNEPQDAAHYMLTMGALAQTLVKNKPSVKPPLALTLACQILLATAKTAPFPSKPKGKLVPFVRPSAHL